MSEKTILEKIRDKEIPADIIYEDSVAIAFRDVNPVAPFHVLVIPKQRSRGVANYDIEDGNDLMHLGSVMAIAAKLAIEAKIESYRLVVNAGPDTIPYLHVHVIGGRKLGWPRMIPRRVLIERAESQLEGIKKRALMYGGTWEGVETMIMSLLDDREFALAWPSEPPGRIGRRWNMACNKVNRSSSACLISTLRYDNITEHEDITECFNKAIEEFLSCDGLYAEVLQHRQCVGCQGLIHMYNGPAHCSGGCGIFPCNHVDGVAEVEHWKAIFARP